MPGMSISAIISACIGIAGILITLTFVIGTHEAAHFAMARALRVKVLKFSIGFGKKIFGFHDKSGTEYQLALIPIGGYVKMLDEGEETVADNEKKYAYNNQPFYKKALIILAGPMMNILCALIIYWIIYTMGFMTIRPIISNVSKGSIAAEAGFKPYQEITSIDGHNTLSWTSVIFRLIAHLGDQDSATVTVTNVNPTTFAPESKETFSINFIHWQLDSLKPDPLSSLGLIPYAPKNAHFPKNWLRHVQYGPLAAMPHAWSQAYNFTYFNLLFIGKLITGKMSLQSLGGPITIFDAAGTSLNQGILPFIGFLAFLSIAIGVINLLPIPGLDGGHFFIQLIEFLLQRKIPDQVLFFMYRIGLIILVLIFFQAMLNDILRVV